MEGVVLRAYHVAELGKSLLPEPLARGSVCVHIVQWRILRRITRAVKSGKNVKHTAQFDIKENNVVSLNCYILKYSKRILLWWMLKVVFLVISIPKGLLQS